MDRNTLEWAMLNCYRACKACGKKLTVHAFRRKMKGKPEVIYAHCSNKDCKEYGVETPPHTHERR